MKRLVLVGALSLLLGTTASAALAAPPSVAAEARPSAAEQAWERYHATLKVQHERVLASEFAKDPMLRAQGLYFLQGLQATAFNMYIAPRQQYPALYVHPVFMPFELSWGLPNPDFLYHWGFIDGAHTYRIYGHRKGAFWSTLQVMRGFWGDKESGTITNINFDDLPAADDDSFEIFLGPNPPSDPKGKTWVKLDPTLHNITMNMRETAYDWSATTPMDVHIEILDRDANAPIQIDEAELARRIDKATAWIVYNMNFSVGYVNDLLGGKGPGNFWGVTDTSNIDPALVNDLSKRNRFALSNPLTGGGDHGGNPLACYPRMVYDIKPDEALIIEMPVVEARYWSLQLGDVWMQTTDYTYHKSSISGAQAKVDKDGKFRAVLAMTDPGVPNWVDPVGSPLGFAQVRWYKSKACIVPSVQKVKLAEVRKFLPKETAVVSAAERKAELEARRVASLHRYGY